jgi:GTPase
MSDHNIRILDPEIEEGNIEYKRELHNHSEKRFQELASQMAWRLNEGKRINGEAHSIYYIGIDDDGALSGIDMNILKRSINILNRVIKICDAEKVSTEIIHYNEGVIAKITIQKLMDTNKEEIRIALLGPENAGKSTLLGVLTYGDLDDGNGSARNNIFRYDHEFENGITSSIKHEIMGISSCDSKSKHINYQSDFTGTWETIVKKSDKIINFIDLPGREKYMKTTLFGLMAYKPHYVAIISNINTTSKESDINSNVLLCKQLGLQCFVVLTSIDNITNTEQTTYKGDDHKECPIMHVSSVTGEGMDTFVKYIDSLPIMKYSHHTNDESAVKFLINDVFYTSDVGIVVAGILERGKIELNDEMLIGPYKNIFFNATIVSIHKKQIPSKQIEKGEHASIVVKVKGDIKINKHMSLITDNVISDFVNKFSINIPTPISNSSQPLEIGRQYVVNDELIINVSFINNNIRYIENNDSIIIRSEDNLFIGRCLIDLKLKRKMYMN